MLFINFSTNERQNQYLDKGFYLCYTLFRKKPKAKNVIFLKKASINVNYILHNITLILTRIRI
jgi:hypothetical protein